MRSTHTIPVAACSMALCTCIALGACTPQSTVERDGMQSADSFDNVSNDIDRIRLGDTYSEVLQILGTPTHDDKIVPKEVAYSIEPLGRTVMYIYNKADPDLINDRTDTYLLLRFDPDGILVDIYFNRP
jgi:hypothetical protein